MPDFTEMNKVPKSENSDKTIKARDIALGFFGWAVFSNLTFLLLLFSGWEKFFDFNRLIFWLIAITSVIVLFVKKRIWVCAGIVANIAINLGVWAYLYFPMRHNELGEMIGNGILPFPSSIMLMFQ